MAMEMTIKLEENYRSSKAVLDVAAAVRTLHHVARPAFDAGIRFDAVGDAEEEEDDTRHRRCDRQLAVDGCADERALPLGTICCLRRGQRCLVCRDN